MAFNTVDTQEQNTSNNTDSVQVDWAEINEYVVETANLQQPETLIGYVASIVDLGMQEQPDAEVTFVGTAEDEVEAIEKMPDTYFKDGIDPVSKKPVRLKCWPQKPLQCITMAIDLPDVIVDKGQFFGESKPLPLRLWLGGQFYTKESGMIVGRPTPLKIRKNTEGKWSFDKKHLLHKMAVGAKLIPADGVFLPQQIDQLLGKAFQFQAQVFFKKGKDKKEYYTEDIKFVGSLGRGQSEPEKLTTPFVVQFSGKNDETAIKELRASIVNTMKRANNYATSDIRKQIEELRYNPEKKGTSESQRVPEAPKKQEAKQESPKKPIVEDDFEDSIPF